MIDSTYNPAPDGIVGPRHEKKGSYHTVRDVFSPVQIDAPVLDDEFTGKFTIHNRYDFRSLAGCNFEWSLLRFPKPSAVGTPSEVLGIGKQSGPDIAAGADGTLVLALPNDWRNADALSLVANDSDGQPLWTWTWPTVTTEKPADAKGNVSMETANDEIVLKAANSIAAFDARTGLLKTLRHGDQTTALTNGPRVVYARPARGEIQWLEAVDLLSAPGSPITWQLEPPRLLNLLEVELDLPKNINWAGFKLEISPDGQVWKTLYDATRRSSDGKLFEFPPQTVAAVRLSDFRQVDGKRPVLKHLRAAYQAERFPLADTAPAKVTTGTDWLESAAANGSDHFRWTMLGSAELRLDYSYKLDGEVTYQGVTFDHPPENFKSVRWLGEGPSRVWQNRLRGTTLGVYGITANDIQPGESWDFPEFQGCFAGLRWARFETTGGPLTVSSSGPGTYLRIGTPRISHPFTTVAFPAGDLSFLESIPAIGSKFIRPEKTGPSSQPVNAAGVHSGSLVFRVGE